MKNVVYGSGHVDVVRNVVAYHPKVRVFDQMSGVPLGSGNQIIDRKHIPAALDKVIAQMRT
jgi:hypothetical protein